MSSEELPEVFDPSQYEGTEFVPIPPGWQSAQIVEASRKEALNNSASTYVLAVFEILEGVHKGRKIFQNVTLTNANQQAVEIGTRLLKDICESVKTGPLKNLEVLLYKPVKVRLGIKRDKDGVYPDRNQVRCGRMIMSHRSVVAAQHWHLRRHRNPLVRVRQRPCLRRLQRRRRQAAAHRGDSSEHN